MQLLLKSGSEVVRTEVVLRGRKVTGGVAEGEALVSRQGISFWLGVNYRSGVIVEKGHDLCGKSLQGRILVFPYSKGSLGSARGLYYLKMKYGNAPKAILVRELTTEMAAGVIMAKIPTMTDFDKDPTETVESGDFVEIDADKGVVKVFRM
jgi:hypothetical protein